MLKMFWFLFFMIGALGYIVVAIVFFNQRKLTREHYKVSSDDKLLSEREQVRQHKNIVWLIAGLVAGVASTIAMILVVLLYAR